MGYITEIIFMYAFRKDGKPDEESVEDEIHEKVDKATGIYTKLDPDPTKDEISEIARKYPDFVIEVEGRGGDQEDLWRRRYHNDKYETITPVWPEYKTILETDDNDRKESNPDVKVSKKKLYQPVWYHDDDTNIDYGELPEGLFSFQAFATKESCNFWLKENNFDPGDFVIIEYDEGDIENVTILDE